MGGTSCLYTFGRAERAACFWWTFKEIKEPYTPINPDSLYVMPHNSPHLLKTRCVCGEIFAMRLSSMDATFIVSVRKTPVITLITLPRMGIRCTTLYMLSYCRCAKWSGCHPSTIVSKFIRVPVVP